MKFERLLFIKRYFILHFKNINKKEILKNNFCTFYSLKIKMYCLQCTRVLVTHRLNTVEKADKILIMDNGKIIDYGNHYYLYKNNKYYCDLYDSYMNKYQEEEVK